MREFCAARRGMELDDNWVPIRSMANRYMQDRAAMQRDDFTGIKGIPTQDMAMWESMGPIADRSRERLGASDLAIGQFRRQMVAAARRFRDGGPAIGVGRTVPMAKLRSFEGVVPKSTDWRTLAEPEGDGQARQPISQNAVSRRVAVRNVAASS